MDASFFYESTLRIGDQVVHEWGKTNRQHLGNDLGDSVNEADGAEVPNPSAPSFFGSKTIFAEFSQCRLDVCRLLN